MLLLITTKALVRWSAAGKIAAMLSALKQRVVTFLSSSAPTKNKAELQPGKVSMDYGALRSPWKRVVCCLSQCQIENQEGKVPLSAGPDFLSMIIRWNG